MGKESFSSFPKKLSFKAEHFVNNAMPLLKREVCHLLVTLRNRVSWSQWPCQEHGAGDAAALSGDGGKASGPCSPLAASASLPNAASLFGMRSGQTRKCLMSHHSQEVFGNYWNSRSCCVTGGKLALGAASLCPQQLRSGRVSLCRAGHICPT